MPLPAEVKSVNKTKQTSKITARNLVPAPLTLLFITTTATLAWLICNMKWNEYEGNNSRYQKLITSYKSTLLWILPSQSLCGAESKQLNPILNPTFSFGNTAKAIMSWHVLLSKAFALAHSLHFLFHFNMIFQLDPNFHAQIMGTGYLVPKSLFFFVPCKLWFSFSMNYYPVMPKHLRLHRLHPIPHYMIMIMMEVYAWTRMCYALLCSLSSFPKRFREMRWTNEDIKRIIHMPTYLNYITSFHLRLHLINFFPSLKKSFFIHSISSNFSRLLQSWIESESEVRVEETKMACEMWLWNMTRVEWWSLIIFGSINSVQSSSSWSSSSNSKL